MSHTSVQSPTECADFEAVSSSLSAIMSSAAKKYLLHPSIVLPAYLGDRLVEP